MVSLYHVNNGQLLPVARKPLATENQLQQWIAANPRLIGLDVLVLGCEVATDFGGRIDILALDREGDVVIIECKRDRTPHDIIAQILDYGSWVASLSTRQVHEIAASKLGNVGHGEHRSWEDMRRYGFIAAGGGRLYSDPLRRLSPGDRVCAYQKQHGYVGFGVVTAPPVPVREFAVSGQPILSQPLDCRNLGHDADEPDNCEYLVGMKWLKTFPLNDARTFAGVFANQNIVCKLRDTATIDFLKGNFPIDAEVAVAAGR